MEKTLRSKCCNAEIGGICNSSGFNEVLICSKCNSICEVIELEHLCKNCMHWERCYTDKHVSTLYGDCKKSVEVLDLKADKMLNGYELEPFASTGENFGCIHFEIKEKNETN